MPTLSCLWCATPMPMALQEDMPSHMSSICRNRTISCIICKLRAPLPGMLQHLRLHQTDIQLQLIKSKCKLAAAAAAAARRAASGVAEAGVAGGDPRHNSASAGRLESAVQLATGAAEGRRVASRVEDARLPGGNLQRHDSSASAEGLEGNSMVQPTTVTAYEEAADVVAISSSGESSQAAAYPVYHSTPASPLNRDAHYAQPLRLLAGSPGGRARGGSRNASLELGGVGTDKATAHISFRPAGESSNGHGGGGGGTPCPRASVCLPSCRSGPDGGGEEGRGHRRTYCYGMSASRYAALLRMLRKLTQQVRRRADAETIVMLVATTQTARAFTAEVAQAGSVMTALA